MNAEHDALSGVLAALADPMRRRILDGLSEHGTGTATTLAAGLPVTRQAVVKHLAVLAEAGLITGRRAGREVRYVLVPQRMDTTVRWMAGLATQWDTRLHVIKQLAELDD